MWPHQNFRSRAATGTDNKSTAEDVLQRWAYIKRAAEEHGIWIAGFSSDGDTRLLKAMRINCSLPVANNDEQEWEWFQMDQNNVEECYLQDTVHILTKLRTRILKPGIVLPLGNFNVTVDHLKQLITQVTKDKHMLTPSDLKPDDKMNFLAAQKMCSNLVTVNLEAIPHTEGTRAYLKLMNFVLSASLDNSLDLSVRLYRIS